MTTISEALTRLLPKSWRAPGAELTKGSHVGPLVAYGNLGQPVWAPRDYATFAREGFMQNAIVYRSVRMIGEAAATIPLLLYEGDTEIEAHPLLDLIRRPSHDHTGTDFFESWYGFLLVAGNAYVEAVALDGQLRELHILRPDRMKVIPGPDGWPEGYEYTAGGQSVRFHDEPVAGVRPILHVRLFHPVNDHYGMSPIEAAATAIDIHNTASGWNKALLDNSARPSGALVYAASNGQMTGEQFERLKSELETSFQGAAHAGRPLLLEGGLDWKPLSLTPKDMDFIEAKNSAAREIALALGVPPMLLGIPGDNTYATEPVRRVLAEGVAEAENVHTLQAATDWDAALDQMQVDLPNAKQVSLVVSWFGTDLRAGNCQIKPGVEQLGKTTAPISWQVAGVARADAYKVSQIDGRAAYGGTPSDQTVIAAIRDMNARGLKVTLTPFVLMDVPADNVLPNPYGGSSQPAYPWRGRITCHPAAGQPGTVDKTAAAATQISAFVGTALPAHYALSGDEVVYSGPAEWTYRRMVLHQAYLAKAAGGVEAFVIGTELRGLSRVRSNANTFPFVTALVALASDVKTILGPGVKVLYAADWSEYFGYQPGDGTGDVYFHLDPLWASPNIDAIGIDVYWPLADWRDGRGHLDYLAGTRSVYDLAYLKSNVQGGEGYDWYYASDAARASQTRTPITDGAGKPWVFRYKDIKNWWLNQHFNRPAGVESASPTAWVPQSKPFWLMEIGCPAVDKGANQPNVFVDPKSIENALPYFSTGVRDDLMQRRFLTAFIHAFDWTKPGYVSGANPVSSVTGERMVALDHIHVYCWDARPYPEFPNATDVWGDGGNWQLGHWVNGRLGTASLSETVSAILNDHQFADHETGALNGSVPGYVIDRIMSVRDALQPLELAYFFDSIESGGRIAFRHRGQDSIARALGADDLVEQRPGAALISLTRGQETELPASAKIRYITASDDYRQAVSEARRLTGASGRVAQADLPIMLDEGIASGIAETWLFETWAARERASFALPPSALGLEPGDLVTYSKAGRTQTLRVTEVSEHGTREIEARGADLDVYGRVGVPARPKPPSIPVQIGQPAAAFLDLPLVTGTEQPESGYVAAVQKPWPGAVAVYASPQTTGYQLKALIDAPATFGVTLDALPPGPEGRIDWKVKIRIKLSSGALSSTDRISMLSGTNLAAIKSASGEWEMIQFATAALVDVSTYEISQLLRGQFGTEAAMAETIGAGATFVLLDAAVARLPMTLSTLNLPFNWRYGAANRNIGDASYAVTQHAFKGVGLRPLSPAHLAGVRNGVGDLLLSWKRRTRIGGDSWDATEVALSEDAERYEVDVMAGATVKRTLTAATPGVTYTAAHQIADFGSTQSSIAVRVYQMSGTFGRGAMRAATL